MTERSAILSQHEVKGILENRLGLLVRPVKLNIRHRDKFAGFGSPGYRIGDHWYSETELIAKCPLGTPGDRLWGRETFSFINSQMPHVCQNAPAFEYTKYQHAKNDRLGPEYEIHFRSTCPETGYHYYWRPSTQMPKWAARIWLENAGVRVVRIQDISDIDITKSGITIRDKRTLEMYKMGRTAGSLSAEQHINRAAFNTIWNRDNPRYPYDLNPWVWLVGTKTLSTTGREE